MMSMVDGRWSVMSDDPPCDMRRQFGFLERSFGTTRRYSSFYGLLVGDVMEPAVRIIFR